jgi:hypothetical protein
MFMQNFNSLASTQTDIANFLTFFQENFRIIQKIQKILFINSKTEYEILYST